MNHSIAAALSVCLVSMPASAGEIRLRVLDILEGAVAGAAVEIRSPSKGERPVSALTDARGELAAEVGLPAEVRVTAVGFDPAVLNLDAPPAGPVLIRLRPATIHATVQVVVRDEGVLADTTQRTAIEIERGGARTVFDAVDKVVPGAYVTRRGVMGYGLNSPSGAVSIRGTGGSPNTQVLIVVDGRPDVMGLMGHPIPDFYTLSDVGSVAVTQGPASLRYGNGAMGGAIEIRRATPPEGLATDFTTSFGSFHTGQHRLSHGMKRGRGFYRLSGGVEHTSGHRPNSAFHNQDGALAAGYDLTPVWKADLQARFGHFNVEDPGTVQAPASGRYANVSRGGFNVTVGHSGVRSWGAANFFASRGHHMLWDGFRSVDQVEGFRISQSFLPAARLTMEAGGDAVRSGGSARNVRSILDYGRHRVSEGGGFVRADFVPSAPVTLNAGLRYNHNSLYGGIAVPEFGALYRWSERFALSAGARRGFRNPTIRELYLFPAPTPTLRPERLWNYQATIQTRPVAPLLAWVTGYYADASDLILTTGRFPNLRLENAGRALNRGLEVNGRWQSARMWTLNVGYAYLRSTNLAPYVPAHKLNYSVEFQAGRVSFTLGGFQVGRTWADAARSRRLPGYPAVTLKCAAPLRDRARVFLMVENLVDRQYEVISGYPMPGLALTGGLQLRF